MMKMEHWKLDVLNIPYLEEGLENEIANLSISQLNLHFWRFFYLFLLQLGRVGEFSECKNFAFISIFRNIATLSWIKYIRVILLEKMMKTRLDF